MTGLGTNTGLKVTTALLLGCALTGLLAAACGGSTDVETATPASTGGKSNGAGATAGADSGGGTSNGGSGNGGSATGSGGAAPIALLPPTPEQQAGCKDYCATAAKASCTAFKGIEDCEASCNIASRWPDCAADWSALTKCSVGKTAVCDDKGEPYVKDCPSESLTAWSCYINKIISDESLQEPCDAYCKSAAVAKCPKEEPAQDCVWGCRAAGTIVPTCKDEWETVLTCSKDKTFQCGDDGKAYPKGCEPDVLTFWACILKEAGNKP